MFAHFVSREGARCRADCNAEARNKVSSPMSTGQFCDNLSSLNQPLPRAKPLPENRHTP